MKKNRIICLLLCSLLLIQSLFSGAGAVDGTAGDASVISGCRSIDAAKPLDKSEKLLDTSKAVLVYEMNSGTLLYTWNADQTIYPASMVKLMTALVALEYGDLSSVATVTRKTLDTVDIGSVSANLKVGEEISLKDLLYCLMVSSANDAAAVIAAQVAGSQEAFIDLMNQKAAELGCTGTHFSNAHGLHHAETYTTARDICRILQAGLEISEFRAMFEAKTYLVPATNKSEERILNTTNYMMRKVDISQYYSKYYDERVTGGKTGSTDQAGRCLAVTAEQDDMRLLAIVMGAEPTYEEEGLSLKTFGSFEEMAQLLDYCFQNYECRQILCEGQALLQMNVSDGANDVVATPVENISTVLPKEMDESGLTWTYSDTPGSLIAPVAQGQKLATVAVWYDGLCVAQSDLVAMNAAAASVEPTEPPQEQKTVEDNDGTLIATILGIILGMVVLAAVILLVVRAAHMAAYRARQRRRRRNRRRNH